jgi:hypothetical protein
MFLPCSIAIAALKVILTVKHKPIRQWRQRNNMAKKSKCELCNKRKYLFAVTKNAQEVKACSNCITEELLTGWSK